MPNCISDTCRRDIDPTWAFCAYCGQDNRPPSDRYAVGDHRHVYAWPRKGCCTLCGEPADEPYPLKRVWRIRAATALIGLGIVLLIFAVMVQLAGHGTHVPFYAWIESWFHHPVRNRRGTTELGHNVSLFLILGSILSVVAGVRMFMKLPFGDTRFADSGHTPGGRIGCLGWILGL
ncbi:MAG: hypothetical protein J0H02_14395 [Armatimonadetes bacterium]|nr:hypothetical protein [Armatimonadota bacterium]